MNTSSFCTCCDPVLHARSILPEKSEIDVVADVFKLFGDSTRVGILCALCRHELCVTDLARVLSMNISAVSHQLRLLRQVGIIKARRDGKSVFYSIYDEHIEEIFNLALKYAEVNNYEH